MLECWKSGILENWNAEPACWQTGEAKSRFCGRMLEKWKRGFNSCVYCEIGVYFLDIGHFELDIGHFELDIGYFELDIGH